LDDRTESVHIGCVAEGTTRVAEPDNPWMAKLQEEAILAVEAPNVPAASVRCGQSTSK
jgi:hypothetical protein